MNKKDSKIAEVLTVPIDKIIENNWNVNVQNEIIFNELVKDIKSEGFDEAIQVIRIGKTDKDFEEGKEYRIIGGAHRYRAAKVLGYTEIPIVIKEYATEKDQKIKTVRRNQLRGDLDRKKFTKLFNSLNSSGINNDFAKQFGFKNKEELKKMIMNLKGKNSKEMLDKLKEVKLEENTITNLSAILNQLFKEYGETVSQSYMYFFYGTKLHLMVMMNHKLKNYMDQINERVGKSKENINVLLERVFEIGLEGLKKINVRK